MIKCIKGFGNVFLPLIPLTTTKICYENYDEFLSFIFYFSVVVVVTAAPAAVLEDDEGE